MWDKYPSWVKWVALGCVVAIIGAGVATAVWIFRPPAQDPAVVALQQELKLTQERVARQAEQIATLLDQYNQVNGWMKAEVNKRVKTKVQTVKNADADALARIMVEYVSSGDCISNDDNSLQ